MVEADNKQLSGKGAIAIRAVNLSYGGAQATATQALTDVSLDIRSGEFFILIGPSGCGKSSLLMMLAGLVQASSGSIHCDATPIRRPEPDLVGVVFQDANLFPWLSAVRNVEFPLMLRQVPAAERRERALEALRQVGLEQFQDHLPQQLSGGMRQRVSIARGMVQKPAVLLMDEPFAALDEQTRLNMGDELLKLWEKTRQTIVFVTHSLSEAVYLGDRIAVMSARPGRVREVIDVDLPRPRNMDMMNSDAFVAIRRRAWTLLKT